MNEAPKYLIHNLHELPEFRSIPKEEFDQILRDYKWAVEMKWPRIILNGIILGSSYILSRWLYKTWIFSGVQLVIWWIATVMAVGLAVEFLTHQFWLRDVRKHLPAFISKWREERDPQLSPEEQRLYEHLRHVRVNLALPKGMLAGDICSDRVLMEMARTQPTVLSQLGRLHGATQKFARDYGKVFLDEISAYLKEAERMAGG